MSNYEINVAFNATFTDDELIPFEDVTFTPDPDFWGQPEEGE